MLVKVLAGGGVADEEGEAVRIGVARLVIHNSNFQ